MYTRLLLASRKALISGVPTAMSQATAFLSGDYKKNLYWWEPLEMCRKLILTGTPPPPDLDARHRTIPVSLLSKHSTSCRALLLPHVLRVDAHMSML
jgi:hypothetical protein|eukprot:4736510-Prymnesium_polylepis.2